MLQSKLAVVVCLILLIGVFIYGVMRPTEAARTYQYKVLSVQGMTELKTQSNTEGGRLVSIEKIINDQAAQGWEFIQADGYALYFRR